MEKKLRIGIIGAGRIGRVHAETLAFRVPEAAPMVIADIHADAAREVAERCGIPRVVQNNREISDDAVDAALICSPTETHADLGMRPRGLGSTSSARSRSTSRGLVLLSEKGPSPASNSR